MTKLKDLSIVIPVYNEAENILETLKSIKKNIKTSHEIIIVYDRNTDTTLPVLKKNKKKFNNFIAIKNDIKIGPSGAIRTGINYSSSPRILVIMADLCDDLTQVDTLVELVPRKYDIACPSRYTKGGKQELDSPFKVGFPKVAGLFLRILTGIKTSDPTNSYKLYSKRVLERMHLKSTISFSVTLEIIAKTHILNGKIFEIPTVWKDRQHGKTNFKLGQSIIAYFPWFLFAISKNRLFNLSFLLKSFI